MSIQLHVTSELERKLKKAASQVGLKPDTYILRLLQKDLQGHPQGAFGSAAPARLSPDESKLLKKINASLSAIEWERYRLLLAQRDAEALNAQEQAELVALSDEIEAANVRRMKAVAELARLRETTVPALMETLGLASA